MILRHRLEENPTGAPFSGRAGIDGESALRSAYVAFRYEVVRHHDKADWMFLLEAAVELIEVAAHDMTHMTSPEQEARLHQLVQSIEQIIRDADAAGDNQA